MDYQFSFKSICLIFVLNASLPNPNKDTSLFVYIKTTTVVADVLMIVITIIVFFFSSHNDSIDYIQFSTFFPCLPPTTITLQILFFALLLSSVYYYLLLFEQIMNGMESNKWLNCLLVEVELRIYIAPLYCKRRLYDTTLDRYTI